MYSQKEFCLRLTIFISMCILLWHIFQLPYFSSDFYIILPRRNYLVSTAWSQRARFYLFNRLSIISSYLPFFWNKIKFEHLYCAVLWCIKKREINRWIRLVEKKYSINGSQERLVKVRGGLMNKSPCYFPCNAFLYTLCKKRNLPYKIANCIIAMSL